MSWKDNLTVVLVEPRNPLNIGAAARAMANFGFTRLALAAPYEVAFREARSAVGAAAVLEAARVAPTLGEALEGCTLVVGTASPEGRVFRHGRLRLPEGARRLRAHLESGRAALLFGSEKFGLSNEQLSYCDWVLRIPTEPDCPSMNLGQAVAVCSYELARMAAARPRAATPQRAAADQRERIAGRLERVLEASGYIPGRTRGSQRLKIRRLVTRLALSGEDAQVMEGMLRQIEWKLGGREG